METHSSKPSRKVVALAILVVAVVLASWLIKTGETNTTGERVNGEPSVSMGERVYVAEKDQDGDGLMDWEEALWGTDPKNPDTDGDGENDSLYVNEVRKKIENDRESFQKILDPRTNERWGDLSYTEQVSQLFLSGYITSKSGGQQLTQEDVLNLIENIPTYEIPERDPLHIFGLSEINISGQNDAGSLYEYGNNVGEVLTTPDGETATNELLALVSFMQTGEDEVFISDINDVVSSYELVIQKLLEVPVPPKASEIHLRIINALSLVQSDLKEFPSFTTDPLLALSVFTSYNENTVERGLAFESLRNFFEESGIVFLSDDPGHILMITPTTL